MTRLLQADILEDGLLEQAIHKATLQTPANRLKAGRPSKVKREMMSEAHRQIAAYPLSTSQPGSIFYSRQLIHMQGWRLRQLLSLSGHTPMTKRVFPTIFLTISSMTIA